MRIPIVVAALVLWCTCALAAGTGRIFVSNENSNEVTVYDPQFAQIKSIPTCARPRDMHFNVSRTQLLVACGDDDAIGIIDLATLAMVDTIATGPSPEMFELSADDRFIYVSNEEDSRLEIIDVAARKTVQTVPTGAEPEGVFLSEDGATLYVTSEIADMVHVVDLAQPAVTRNILVGTRPRRFVATPDGKELWVSSELSAEVQIIDRATHEVTQTLTFLPPGFRVEDVTPVGMAITRDGSRVLLALGRANHLAVIEVATRKVLAYVLVGERAWDVALTADESTAVVADGLSDDITLVDMTALRPMRSIPAGRTPHTVLIDD